MGDAYRVLEIGQLRSSGYLQYVLRLSVLGIEASKIILNSEKIVSSGQFYGRALKSPQILTNRKRLLHRYRVTFDLSGRTP